MFACCETLNCALLQEASKLVQPEEQTNPPAVYLCEHRGLADVYELIAKARVSHLRGASGVRQNSSPV